MILDEYFKRSAATETVEELFEHFLGAVGALGFNRCAFMFFPPQTGTEMPLPSFPIFTFPAIYAERFVEERIYEVDYYLPALRAVGNTVYWADTVFKMDPGKFHYKYADFIKSFIENGHRRLISIPVYGSASAFGQIILQNADPGFEPGQHNAAIARSVADDLMHQYMRLMFSDGKLKPLDLSTREKEVLLWVMKGKSNSVIADIMGLSPHTIDTYIRRCCQKTNASNRTEAAIRAILSGTIFY